MSNKIHEGVLSDIEKVKYDAFWMHFLMDGSV